MDPRDEVVLRVRPGIPRTRGDGPAPLRLASAQEMDSPHARGWTRLFLRRRPRARGFPARAGMDPRCARRRGRPARIPRTRGDGPRRTAVRSRMREDSPHARGWTRARAAVLSTPGGFPARAGMDPAASRRRGPGRGIPRTRGDGPERMERLALSSPDSPHARGWTEHGIDAWLPVSGFPARAGMDRERQLVAEQSRGIPRTRGDGPATNPPSDRPSSDSPHARGWTRRDLRLDRRRGGFPARAGMDLKVTKSDRRGHRIPRTRGDGPRLSAREIELEPDSPHARGWTRISARPCRPSAGFPARAGMDRRASTPRANSMRIPRTRGDGPSARDRGYRLAPDSPHARGWTRGGDGGAAGVRGFPARAGMDPRT